MDFEKSNYCPGYQTFSHKKVNKGDIKLKELHWTVKTFSQDHCLKMEAKKVLNSKFNERYSKISDKN